MTSSLSNAAFFHEDHFITVNKILEKMAVRTSLYHYGK